MEYEINTNTLAVVPMNFDKSYIMEKDNEYYIDASTMDIIDHSCQYYGSSYNGRRIGSFMLIGEQHKTPIIIQESNNIIFFPTKTPKSDECIWISYHNICKFDYGETSSTTSVEFKNGRKLIVPISYYSFSNQYLRAGKLSAIISSRKA